MTESSSQPEPGAGPPTDDEVEGRGPVDQSDEEQRPGVTKDPEDPDDTDFNVGTGLVE